MAFFPKTPKWESQCHNPNLGLVTKARAHKVVGQEGSPRVTLHALESVRKCEGMNLHTPKELPLWEFESRWMPKFLNGDYRGQNSLD